MRRHNQLFLVLFGGLLASTGGCSGSKAVNAIVTLDGKPVEGATVVLTSSSGGPAISGFTEADGTVVLESSTKTGVPPGDYKVVVTKVKALTSQPDMKDPQAMGKAMMNQVPAPKSKDPEAMKNQGSAPKSELPAKYASADTTPLTLKIPADTNPAKIELKSAP